MVMLLRRFLATLFAALCLTGAAMAQERLALVIGIDSYRELTPLLKARADARAVGDSLARLGFKVDLLLDSERRAFNQGLSTFLGKITPGATVYVHFSGHGVEIDNETYLLPADVPMPRAGDQEFVKREAMRLSELIESLRTSPALARVLVIDACRDNPFAQKGTRSVGATRGIAVQPATKGTLVMYSASQGQAALDRLGPQDGEATSVYTRVLLKSLETPGKSLVAVARDVRREVEALAKTVGHEQRPAYYDELSDDFFLAGGGTSPAPAPLPPPQVAVITPPPPVVPGPAPAAPVVPPANASIAYFQTRQVATCGAYEAFVRAFPASFEARLAAEHIRANCAPKPRVSGSATAPNLYRVPIDVADGYLNIRTGPGVSNPAIARIPAGAGSVVVVGNCVRSAEGGTFPWCRVQWQGLSGFASSGGLLDEQTGRPPGGAAAVATAPPSPVGARREFRVQPVISDGVLNMRTGPGQRHGIVTEIPAGSGGVLLGVCRPADDGGVRPWCEARWRQFSGWVSSCCVLDAVTGRRP